MNLKPSLGLFINYKTSGKSLKDSRMGFYTEVSAPGIVRIHNFIERRNKSSCLLSSWNSNLCPQLQEIISIFTSLVVGLEVDAILCNLLWHTHTWLILIFLRFNLYHDPYACTSRKVICRDVILLVLKT